ncbi:MAG: class I SAM-dependent methyltransferase [Nonomuraea sp.]|nr:class I SAM-dependent methyltransferase [Nonomuraea sp.]
METADEEAFPSGATSEKGSGRQAAWPRSPPDDRCAKLEAPAHRRDERTRKIWDRGAPQYEGWMRYYDRFVVRDGRRWVCSQALGRVLEVAVGTGLNLPAYPHGTDLTGVDRSPAMLERARRRATDTGVDVTLTEAPATGLPFPDASVDTVGCTLALCWIPDDRGAVAKMHRVLEPGGTLLLLDAALRQLTSRAA